MANKNVEGKPILVTGAHRSGTTWVGWTLSQAAAIEYVQEPFNVSHPNDQVGLKLNNWFEYAAASGQQEEIASTFDNLLKASSRRILIKDPLALLSAGWLYEKYDFKVICMIRNPFAFVASLKNAGWDFEFKHFARQKELMRTWLAPFSDAVDRLAYDSGDWLDRACMLWNILNFVIMDYRKRYPEWLFVKYEDIADNPFPEYAKLCVYVGLNFDPNIQKYIKDYTSIQDSQEISTTDYRPRNTKACLDSWHRYLSVEMTDRVRIATANLRVQLYGNVYEDPKTCRTIAVQ